MNTKELRKIVDSSFKLNKRSVIPILESIKFSGIKATFTDLELWVQYTIPNIGGEFTFDRADLKTLCITYPNSEFHFTTEGAMVEGKLFKLTSYPNDEFPTITPLSNSEGWLLTKSDQLKLRNLVPFVGKEGIVRQGMTCVYLDKGVGVSTNTHVMRWEELNMELSGFIHPSFFTFMNKEDYYIDFPLEEDKQWCHIYNDLLSISRVQVNDTFPDWRAVLPKYETSIKLIFDKNDLVTFLKKVEAVAKVHKHTFTYIEVTPSLLKYENAEYNVELTHEVNLPENTPMFGLSVPHLLSVLSVIDSKEIVMEIETVIHPIRVNVNSVIMPFILKK